MTKLPLEILEEISEKVISSSSNDMSAAYYVAFCEVINALVSVGAFKSIDDLDRAFKMQDQLYSFLLDNTL